MIKNRTLAPVLLGSLCLILAGCVGMHSRQNHRSSSIADYLYPKVATPLITPSMSQLQLPLKVGVAFAPRERFAPGAISSMQDETILEKVAAAFRSQPFVERIEVVPSSYLMPKGSFANLDQVSRMMNLDVIVLIAYDQVQFTEENLLSLTYWTIVGSYIFKGNNNDTQTLIEAVVYDIPSRTLLFRAPGVSHITSSTTKVDSAEKRRLESTRGLELAIDDMTKNLSERLQTFKDEVRQGKARVAITHAPGYTGGGMLDGVLAVLLLAAGGVCLKRRFSKA